MTCEFAGYRGKIINKEREITDKEKVIRLQIYVLDKSTALLAAEHDAIYIFLNDICDKACLACLGIVRTALPAESCSNFY